MKKLGKFGIGLFVLLMFLFVSCATVNTSAAGNSGMLPNNSAETGKKDSADSEKSENIPVKKLESNNSSADNNVQELSKSLSPLGYDITAEDVLDYGGELLCKLDENFSKLMELAFSGKTGIVDEYYSKKMFELMFIVDFDKKYKKNENFLSSSFPKIRNTILRIKIKGYAGGYVFYDCDADNDSGNADGLKSSECGWRYLEAAPEDLSERYDWGDDGSFGTKTGIGEGRNNTNIIIVNNASNKRKDNAAAACVMYAGGGYSDWFLPSKDELNLMYKNLKEKGVGNFRDAWYWSGSENGYNRAWYQDFDDGWQYNGGRNNNGYVRPVRAFI